MMGAGAGAGAAAGAAAVACAAVSNVAIKAKMLKNSPAWAQKIGSQPPRTDLCKCMQSGGERECGLLVVHSMDFSMVL